jgi:Tol biopolymer transport system component/serine/threonine protein kinase
VVWALFGHVATGHRSPGSSSRFRFIDTGRPVGNGALEQPESQKFGWSWYAYNSVIGLPSGARISHFDILEKLGEGGMGAVYKARDRRLDRLVAIKVLSGKAAADPERQARLVQEAKTASALNHPHIVTIYEIDVADGLAFIAMEYIEGRTLEQLIPSKGLRFVEALRFAIQAADALAAAHAAGIVHRDVKPANVMVSTKGIVKVLDFGIAKLKDGGATNAAPEEDEATVTVVAPETRGGSILGTVAYMSPEQAEGKEIDSRSDIFSFGVMLYEMLTGRRPFRGDTQVATVAAIVHQEPPPVRQLAEAVPADLDRVVSRCLRKDPARRFQTMADLKVTLEELKEESDSGRLALAAPQRPASRRRLWQWAAAALLLAAVAGIWLLRKTAPAPEQTLVAVTSYQGSQMYPSFSPDGRQIAFTWDGEKGDNVDIYVKLVDETNALRLTSDPAVDAVPVWSPDGKRIAFRRYGPHEGIYTVSALGGVEQKVAELVSPSVFLGGQISWSPDGKWLAVGANERTGTGISLLPVEGGDPRQLTSRQAPSRDTTPSFSLDGRKLAYVGCSTGDECDVYIADLSPAYTLEGAPRRITNHNAVLAGMSWTRDGKSVVYSASMYSAVAFYLWRVGVDGRQPPERLEIAGRNATFPSASPTNNRLVFSRNLQDWDIWRYRVGGTAEPFVVSSLVEDCPQFSADGSKIAFESNRGGGPEEIWVAQADGSNPVQMTRNLGRHQGSPRWSPDGRWIAFDSLGNNGRRHIYVMEASGGRPRRINQEEPGQAIPSWSNDGKWIYFYSDRSGRNEIWRMPFGSGAPEQITREGGHAGYESADGTTVFYLKNFSSPLFARALTGGPERLVLDWVSMRAFFPVKDGIYYIGRRGEDGQYPLAFYEFASGTSKVLTRLAGPTYLGLGVSPDRKDFLFTRTLKEGANLMMIENLR